MAVELGLKEGETTLHFLPLFSSCLEQLIPLTLLGSTHVIMPHFDAPEAWRLIGEHGVTHFDAVPTVLRRLFDERPPVPPASLRVVSYASEPMPARLIAELTEYAPDISFVQFYGMIEHLCLTALKPNEQLRPSGTVGRPMLGTSLRILDEHQLEVLTGEVGEIVAKGPTIMAGYWEDEIATDQVISSGWMRTGDLARVDEDGYVVLSGRIKEVIKTGGMTVIPREVEEVLRGHPSVEDAAVVGAPSEEWGEEVRAFVVLDESLVLNTAAGELLGHCRQHLPGYKCPKRIEVISELPKTGIGKVARSRLLHDG
jgi:acyl-CoA synthetase (AMP-forming)/AMP-acid ligase II